MLGYLPLNKRINSVEAGRRSMRERRAGRKQKEGKAHPEKTGYPLVGQYVRWASYSQPGTH